MTHFSATQRREGVDEVATRVYFTVETTMLPSEARRNGNGTAWLAELFSLGSSRRLTLQGLRGVLGAGRRKHIADGPKGAASMGASKAKADPPRIFALPRFLNAGGIFLLRPF